MNSPNQESPMQHPPRFWLSPQYAREPDSASIYFVKEYEFLIEGMSVAEHEALLAQAKREAKAEMMEKLQALGSLYEAHIKRAQYANPAEEEK